MIRILAPCHHDASRALSAGRVEMPLMLVAEGKYARDTIESSRRRRHEGMRRASHYIQTFYALSSGERGQRRFVDFARVGLKIQASRR